MLCPPNLFCVPRTCSEESQVELVAASLIADEAERVVIVGYSRGGNAAIDLANALGKAGVRVDTIVTFDPHSLFVSPLNLDFDTVGRVLNYFQQNEGNFLNAVPSRYDGSVVQSPFLLVQRKNYTGKNAIHHSNIVSRANQDYRGTIKYALQ